MRLNSLEGNFITAAVFLIFSVRRRRTIRLCVMRAESLKNAGCAHAGVIVGIYIRRQSLLVSLRFCFFFRFRFFKKSFIVRKPGFAGKLYRLVNVFYGVFVILYIVTGQRY